MLDLSIYIQKTWEVKLTDEETLEILKPSADLLVKLESFINIKNSKKTDLKRLVTLTEDIAHKVLSNNKQNKEIKIEYIKELGFDLQILIMNQYFKFVEEVMSNPN